jgi:putative endonuclease
MAQHITLGEQGEELAAKWLTSKGFEVLHRNWRYSHYEIDIVAKKQKMLHFIEVKARNHSHVGFPEDGVRKKKFRNLKRAADQYLYLHPGNKWIEYNILAITFFKDREPECFLFEDVYL